MTSSSLHAASAGQSLVKFDLRQRRAALPMFCNIFGWHDLSG